MQVIGMTMTNWCLILLVLIIGVVLSTTASFVIVVAWLTPILGAAVAYPVFLQLVYRKQHE